MGSGSSSNKYQASDPSPSKAPAPAAVVVNPSVGTDGSRYLHIVHFNDVYNLNSSYEEEPRGGARKFATAVKKYKQDLAAKSFSKPLVLFSGDFVGPSLMSSFTQGAHLIDALNAIGTDFGTFGNHELDYGYESLKARLHGIDDDVFDGEVGVHNYETTETRWIMSNITEAATGLPMGGKLVSKYALVEWGGEFGCLENDPNKQKSGPIKVGILAVSENWLKSCSQLSPNVLVYEDYIESARKTAIFLRQQGAEIVLAITHNRLANDYKLTEAVPEIDLLLGGHDHFYKADLPKRIVKTGEEWRWLSRVEIELKSGSKAPIVTLTTDEITSDISENIMIDALCDKYDAISHAKFSRVIFDTAVDMNPMEEFVRFKESAICNWCCDMCCDDYSLQEGIQAADISVLLGFNFAGKALIPAGKFTLGNLFGIFPLPALMMVIKITGQNIVDSLTEGAASLPGECGSIHHVSSNLSYTIVLTKPPSIKDVMYKGKPINLAETFTVSLPSSMCTGKFGYKWNVTAEKVVREEYAPQLQDLIIMYCKRHMQDATRNPANPSMGRIKIESP